MKVTFDGNDTALAVLTIVAKYYQQIACKSWITTEVNEREKSSQENDISFQGHSMPLAALRIVAKGSTDAVVAGVLPEAQALRHCPVLSFPNGAIVSDKQQLVSFT